MRKDDVEFHSYLPYGGPPLVPAVNVKVDFPFGDGCSRIARDIGGEPFVQWLEDTYPDGDFDPDGYLFEMVCSDGWKMLQDDVSEIYRPFQYKLCSAGRNGGWAYIEGLKDFEDWDAIDLSRWARFSKYARAYADDVPYQMLSSLYINEYEVWSQEQRDLVKLRTMERGGLMPTWFYGPVPL